MPPAVTLEGSRVRLEPLALSHVDALVQAAAESRDTFGFTLVPDDRAAMVPYVQAALADQGSGMALPFALHDLRREAVVGTTRFLDLDYWSWPPAWPPGRTIPRPGAIPTVAEIGSTWLAPSAQRTHCNTEAKLLMLAHAFDTWGVLRVTLKTDSRNSRSRRAIERIGGRFEGIRRAHARAADGSIRDTAYYSIVAAEWPDIRTALEARMNAIPSDSSLPSASQPRELSTGSAHSKRSPGTGLLRISLPGVDWWGYVDLNHGPLPYQGSALTD